MYEPANRAFSLIDKISKNKYKILIAILLFFLVSGSFTVIPSGYSGVRTTFGQIDEKVVGNGLVWKIPFIQSIQKVNNKQQELTTDRNYIVWGEANDQTEIKLEGITVTYQVNPEYSAWVYANVTNYSENALPSNLFVSSIKAATRQFEASEVMNRQKVETEAKRQLQANLNELYGDRNVVIINKVSIESINYGDDYNTAIVNRQTAEILKEEQETKNKMALDKATAEAEAKRIAATAEADAVRIVAQAQAEANEMLTGTISDVLIDYEMVQKWNGQTPYVTGGNGSLIGIDIPGSNPGTSN